jgi:hypothetical protein
MSDPETEEVSRPVIKVRKGDLPRVLDASEDALILGGVPIYQRGLNLYHPVRADAINKSDPDGAVVEETGKSKWVVRRRQGTLVLSAVTAPWLRERMIETAEWFAYKGGKADAGWYLIEPEMLMVNTLISRQDWRFPVLRGISAAPLLDIDGRIVETEGYDKGTGMLLEFGDLKFPPVPTAPTREDALAALQRLARPFREMPWGNSTESTRTLPNPNRSVALSGMLTVMVRSSMRAAPLHIFDAPVPASGKSMIADCIGIVKTGSEPAAMSQGPDDEEDEKRLSTVLASGDPVILLDNCTRPLTGDFLCSVLTQEVVQARILGQSERRVMPSASFLIATGNNMITAGDTFRRVVLCTLDPKCERPDERKFDFDAREEVRAERVNLAIDALTCLKAYRVAGDPLRDTLKPMGSFEDWDWIRETLVWLGEIDPAETRQTILSNDSAAQELEAIMTAWEKEFGDKLLAVSDLRPDSPTGRLLQEATNKNDWSPKSVGRWLNRHKDRVKAGKTFRIVSKKGGTITWILEGAQARLKARPEVQIDDHMVQDLRM